LPVSAVQLKTMRLVGGLQTRIYRTSNGRVWHTMRGLPVLLLTVPGRKTRIPRTTPISYVRDGDRYVVTGSGAGLPAEPLWFRNLRAANRAEIQVGPAHIAVSVMVASSAEHTRLWAELVRQAPYFANYQAKVQREIPMAVLTPVTSPDQPAA
jgi:deazaflavin-dependent oxidoreductase (nitroreductase family)